MILKVRLHRTAATELYVVVVALIPLLLGLLLLIVFSMHHRTGTLVGPEGITGVAAVLLATLPIRLVLVPGEISDLTLVDYVARLRDGSSRCACVRRGLEGSRPPANPGPTGS
jgi:hypothetical protein